jgi:hypothetical protein
MKTPPALTPGEVIDALFRARAVEKAAALEQVELAIVWAQLHPCAEGATPAYMNDLDLPLDLHGESTIWLSGEGAPSVAEFAPVELAAALGLTAEAGHQLLADAVELHYRLPRLMEHVRSGLVPVWLARRIAALTTDLSWDAVVFADKLVSATPERMNEVRADKIVHEARLYFDPDRAQAEDDDAMAKRGVWLRRGANPAMTDVTMTLDSDDAALFDQTLGRIAADLMDLGDTDGRDQRRAKAVGILADPQYALDLMSGREAGPTSGLAGDLVVHFRPSDFTTGPGGGPGAADAEKLGAITADLLAAWLAHHDLTKVKFRVRPVLDLGEDWSVDAHDPPDRMREQVLLLHATCVFPGCHRDSRGCDLDHIEPYVPPDDGGPPGQTRPENLAPLCRRHHRAKTHSAWDYKQTAPGHFAWTSPTGHQYDVRSTPRHARW